MSSERVLLNVGGMRYETTRSTLQALPETMLGRMFANDNQIGAQRDSDGSYFFDRNGRLFEYILDAYRRGGQVHVPDTEQAHLQPELEYWGLAVLPQPSAQDVQDAADALLRDKMIAIMAVHADAVNYTTVLQAVGANACRFRVVLELMGMHLSKEIKASADNGFVCCEIDATEAPFSVLLDIRLARNFFTPSSRFTSSANAAVNAADMVVAIATLDEPLFALQLCIAGGRCCRLTVCGQRGTVWMHDFPAASSRARMLSLVDVPWEATARVDVSALRAAVVRNSGQYIAMGIDARQSAILITRTDTTRTASVDRTTSVVLCDCTGDSSTLRRFYRAPIQRMLRCIAGDGLCEWASSVAFSEIGLVSFEFASSDCAIKWVCNAHNEEE